MNLKPFSSLFFFNTDILVTIYLFDLKLSVSLLNDLLEGRVSQIFDLGSSSYFMSRRVTFLHFLKLGGNQLAAYSGQRAKLFKTEKKIYKYNHLGQLRYVIKYKVRKMA